MPAMHLFEMTDTPVAVEAVEGERIRIAWGSDAVLTVDIGEAVDLVDAVLTALGFFSDDPEKGPISDPDLLRDATKNILSASTTCPDRVLPGSGKKGYSTASTPVAGLFGDATENDLAALGSSELPDPPHGFDAVLPSEWTPYDGLMARQWNLRLDGGHVLCVEDLVNSEGEVTRAGLSINLVGLDDTVDPTALLEYMRTVEAAIDTFQRLRGL